MRRFWGWSWLRSRRPEVCRTRLDAVNSVRERSRWPRLNSDRDQLTLSRSLRVCSRELSVSIGTEFSHLNGGIGVNNARIATYKRETFDGSDFNYCSQCRRHHEARFRWRDAWCRLLPTAASIASVEKDGRTNRAGLFFAELPSSGSYVNTSFGEDEEVKLRDLAAHCNGGKTERAYGLLSVTPPLTTNWVRRAASADELLALRALLKSDAQRYNQIVKSLKLSATSVVTKPGSTHLTIVVPGEIVSNDDAHCLAQRHHVFVRRNNVYAYRGMLPAKPEKYFDVDGDDVPEIMVSVGCDGWCISL